MGGAGRGGPPPEEGGLGEGVQQQQEEQHPQQVAGEQGPAPGVLQGGPHGREPHGVAEGMAQHRARQVACGTDGQTDGGGGQQGRETPPSLPCTPPALCPLTCPEEDEGRVGAKEGGVGELESCRGKGRVWGGDTGMDFPPQNPPQPYLPT